VGDAAVGDAVADVDGGDPQESPEERAARLVAQMRRPLWAGRVVALAVTPRRRWKVVPMMGRVVDAGGEALLITADGARSAVADGVERLDLADSERALLPHRILGISPRRLAARLRGGTTSGPSLVWAAYSGSRPYRAVRPWVLWRLLRRRLDQVRVQDVDHLVIVGVESWPIAWHLMRANPRITMSFDLPERYFRPREGEVRPPSSG
jgi:hypothetical protein